MALTGAPLIGAARRLGFRTAGSNFLLPLHFLARTAVADSLFLVGGAGIFAAYLAGLSSAN